MPTLFFMPWTYIDRAKQIGPISLVPYERGESPGKIGDITQQCLDDILKNYADRAYIQHPNSTTPVRSALILRWPSDDERETVLTNEEVEERLQQTQLLIFSAISNRQFGNHFDYCNTDGLTVIAQNFSIENPAATSLTTRRRDGRSIKNITGGTGKPLFLRPMHVPDRYLLRIDSDFANAMLHIPNGDLRNRLLDSITLFNMANTDSNEVPPSAEIVFLRAALETITEAGHKSADLKTRLENIMTPHLGPIKWHEIQFSQRVWQDRWENTNRPFSAWIQDFCHWRNESAHGKSNSKKYPAPIWSLFNHLLFTSWFMGRLVKVILSTNALYTLTSTDKDELENIELLFGHDIGNYDEKYQLNWNKALSHLQLIQLGRLLEELAIEDSENSESSRN